MTTVLLIVATLVIVALIYATARMYVTNPVYMMFFGHSVLTMFTDILAGIFSALVSAMSGD